MPTSPKSHRYLLLPVKGPEGVGVRDRGSFLSILFLSAFLELPPISVGISPLSVWIRLSLYLFQPVLVICPSLPLFPSPFSS